MRRKALKAAFPLYVNDPVQAFLMTLMINARHLFYSISMLDKYKGTGWKKFFLIFGADHFIIPAMIVILLVLTALRGQLEREDTGQGFLTT